MSSCVFITRREYDLLINLHSDYMASGWDQIRNRRQWYLNGCSITIPDPAPQWAEELRVRVENVRRVLADQAKAEKDETVVAR